ADHLSPVTNAPAPFRPPTTVAPGTWKGDNRFLDGFVAGDEVTLQVKVWDGSVFSSFEAANAANGVRGQSAPFTYLIPQPIVPSPDDYFMINLRAFALDRQLTNRTPVAQSQALAVNEDTPLAITLDAVDPDHDLLTFTVLSSPIHGTLTGRAPNLSYQPA